MLQDSIMHLPKISIQNLSSWFVKFNGFDDGVYETSKQIWSLHLTSFS